MNYKSFVYYYIAESLLIFYLKGFFFFFLLFFNFNVIFFILLQDVIIGQSLNVTQVNAYNLRRNVMAIEIVFTEKMKLIVVSLFFLIILK